MLALESGLDAWLRHARLPEEQQFKHHKFDHIIASGTDDGPISVAAKELQHGVRSILGQQLEIVSGPCEGKSSIIVTTFQNIDPIACNLHEFQRRPEADGYVLTVKSDHVSIIGGNERGALYGTFQYLNRLARGDTADAVVFAEPDAPIRWVNQWDNLDGSLERGYGGRSIFFNNGLVHGDLTRARQYARLLASIGLNGVVINNVNSHPSLLSDENLLGIKRIADFMRPYGVQIGVALKFNSPELLGGLPNSDPLNPAVIAWWELITSKLYRHVPDCLGYLIKANSEGQPGPFNYNRSLADAANMFARALKKHGDGLVMYRAFVYNHHLDESNWRNDRANAAVDYFKDLDEQFDDNVIIQIKFGPIDFQVREPVSPLFANLRKTKVMIEFMVAQEYLGQQSHFVYQAPLWKTILDFDLRVDGKETYVRDVVAGKTHGSDRAGFAAVVNVGLDSTWLGSHLAMLNLYAYGRLAYCSKDSAELIAQEWTQLTFGNDERIAHTLVPMAMDSWPAYENYTGNLGIQTLCDIIGSHFGPDPSSQDGNGWGQWTRADAEGLGVDRTVATGSANAGQYPQQVADRFEHIESTPDELLLWFHHVPYSHRLKSGKTVIQHFYDAHYDGAAMAQTFPQRWALLQHLIDASRYKHVARRLEYQAGHALVWRDGICRFYHNKCKVDDEKKRVHNHEWRIPAHEMSLEGYEVVPVTPPEMAADGKAISTVSASRPGVAKTRLEVASGTYNIAVNYYDHLGGRSSYKMYLNETLAGEWTGNLEDEFGHDFSSVPDGASALRIYFCDITVNHGDLLTIIGTPDRSEGATLDYVSVLPPGQID